MTWNPSPENAQILDRAMEHVNSVPYQVTTRWVFYRLLQQGLYHAKEDYNRLKYLLSKARKEFYGGWAPDTLADDTRAAIRLGVGHENAEDYLDALVRNGITVRLSSYYRQENYVVVAYEARGMTQQFRTYAPRIDLWPYGGDTSIRHKWNLAKAIEENCDGKPVHMIYFGDYDPKGLEIPYSALRDIEDWCSEDINFIHAGLSREQATSMEVPEDPDRPNHWQWVALTDGQAQKIITEALEPYWDLDIADELAEDEQVISDFILNYLKNIRRDWDKR
jgi:hypothetical protein